MEMGFRYTEEQIDYVRTIAKGRYNDEITAMFNKKFNLDKTVSQINSMKKNHGITSGKLPKRSRPEARLFTKEQEKFVRENAKGRYNDELAQMVNEKFGLNITARQMATWKKNHDVKSGLTGQFEKGQTAWNKGMKGLNTGGEAGWFKKGQQPINYRPVGSERVDSKDGYIVIKVQDEGAWSERWRHKHVVVWEKEYGEVPQGHVVAFLDNDKTNVDIDNLVLLSRAELALMNKNDLFSDDPEITKAGINLVRLNMRISVADLKGNDPEKFEKYMKLAESNGIKEQTFVARLKRGWSFEEAAKLPLHTRRSRK